MASYRIVFIIVSFGHIKHNTLLIRRKELIL